MLRLTEKLNSQNRLDELSKQDDGLNVASSVCHYIRKILNTREGSVLINPKLGMPSFNLNQGLDNEDDQLSFLTFINSQIKLAEPRVLHIQSYLMNNKNISAVMTFKLIVKTISKGTITMNARLQSDSTFDVELA